MRLACIITCVNYGDILAATLATNRVIFDYTVVATTPDDLQTQKVCEFWNVDCIKVPEFTKDAAFRKGAGINAAIKRLQEKGQADGWVFHADADIFFPPLTRQVFSMTDLDPTMLYGVDRLMCKSFEDWYDFLLFPKAQQENNAFVHVRPFEVGVRVYSHGAGYGGWVPIGFTQIWCPSKSNVWTYPDEHTTAGRGDMLFAKQWPRSKRGMIPEIIVYHLESEEAAMGTNWSGRKTKTFGPVRVPEATPTPYMTDEEVAAVESLLLTACEAAQPLAVLEWGAGGSTCTFPKDLRAKGKDVRWLAIEHDENWALRVRKHVDGDRDVVQHVYVADPEQVANWEPYIHPVGAQKNTYHVILVDGRCRRRCLEAAQDLLAPGGIVILHDAERTYYHPALEHYDGAFVLPRLWVGTRKVAKPGPAPVDNDAYDPVETRDREISISLDDLPKGTVSLRVNVTRNNVHRTVTVPVRARFRIAVRMDEVTRGILAIAADGTESDFIPSYHVAL